MCENFVGVATTVWIVTFLCQVRLSDQVLAPAASRSFRGSQEGPGPGGRETSYYRDPKSVRGKSRDAASVGGAILPEFEDENRTVVVGKPGGKVHLDCNIFMLQDFTVSWAHKTSDGGLDFLTIGNSTYTSESRISSVFLHPSNWGLRIANLQPSDAGTYICQLSTFPPKVRLVFLEMRGPMVEINKEDRVVYNAGSNLEVSCIYQNTTTTGALGKGTGSDQKEKLTEAEQRRNDVLRIIQNSRLGEVPKDALVWMHNGKRFSHRNRRRVKISRQMEGHILSRLTIKSAIIEDSGNYTCVLPTTNYSDTVRLVVVSGEHSAAIESSQSSGVNSVSTATADAKILSLQILIPFFYIILT